jgi:metal-responsive CopG/Arc/MetJ family transcriptional regulator
MANQPASPTTVRVTISLPPEALEKLDRVARASSRTRSNAVLRIIEQTPEPKS